MQQNTIGVLIFASVECLIYQKHDGNWLRNEVLVNTAYVILTKQQSLQDECPLAESDWDNNRQNYYDSNCTLAMWNTHI